MDRIVQLPLFSNEEWRPIVGFEGIYSVSNLGRVRDEINRNRYEAGRIRIGEPNSDGYLRISLTKDKRRKKYFVHWLVAEAFIGKAQLGMEVNHINTIKTDNRVENLEWVTHKQNMHHAMDKGLWNPGAYFGTHSAVAKLDADKVREIRKRVTNGENKHAIAQDYGVSRNLIDAVMTGKVWRHVE